MLLFNFTTVWPSLSGLPESLQWSSLWLCLLSWLVLLQSPIQNQHKKKALKLVHETDNPNCTIEATTQNTDDVRGLPCGGSGGFFESLRMSACNCVHVRDKQQKIPHRSKKTTARTHQIQPVKHRSRNTEKEIPFPLRNSQDLWEKSLFLSTAGFAQQEKPAFGYILYETNHNKDIRPHHQQRDNPSKTQY